MICVRCRARTFERDEDGLRCVLCCRAVNPIEPLEIRREAAGKSQRHPRMRVLPEVTQYDEMRALMSGAAS